MFRRRGTIIAEGLKIVGSVTAEGLVEVNGQIEGDLYCTALVVSPKASILGGIQAERVVVNGRVEGPIRGGDVVLKSRAHVVGDIQHETLSIDSGAYFDGRSVRTGQVNGQAREHAQGEKVSARPRKEAPQNGREVAAA
ncbi:MAG TPA: polymer-forming cytoskeletal protein [Methyloceanibacter sp.]|jgi:cytoskeletal protein CcmA (bactofilin family)|nr:polymer-forming cytoskeletal protein [Methyloceanibacter sp.]